MAVNTNGPEDRSMRLRKWVGYVATILLEAALTGGLLLLMPVFPLGNFPIPYVLLTMVVAYLFAEGPAILSVFLGWFLFTYFFVPPPGISWPLAHSVRGWAQQTALLLGVTVVGAAMVQARRSNRRIQRLADQAIALNESLQAANEELASTNEELAASNEELMATTKELYSQIEERKRAEDALRESEERVRVKLESILSPEGDIGDLELADIIDTPQIQALMDSFYELARVPMAIVDVKGNVLVGVGWQDVCTRFHRVHPETCKHCLESDTELTAGGVPGEYKLYKCKNNMWDVATPMIVGGEHMGNLFTGQFMFENEQPDYEIFRRQAREYGFDEGEYIKALDSVPRLSKETLDQAMAFFMKLADMLSKLSYANIKLARSLSERDALMEEVKQLNTGLEQRVAQRTAELENANKELEAFSYSVSHDLRAPLRAIDGFSNALLKNYLDSLDERGQDYLQRVRNAAQRMGNLIDDILGLSRATRAEMHRQPVDMSAVAQEVLGELRKSQPEREAEIRVEPDLVVSADPHLLRIVMDNLLGNAWKFTGKRDMTRIEVGATEQNGRRVYYIRDNGAGFNPAYADKLFGAFQRLHSETDFPGTGIGLALVQRILRKHGGSIWAESEVDRGTTFFFTLGENGI